LGASEANIKSDVWSFGVVLWEIFTLGALPYSELSNKEVITKVQNGHRLSKPTANCPSEIYELMQRCWKDDPSERPSFNQITICLKSTCKILKKEMDNLRTQAFRTMMSPSESSSGDLYSSSMKQSINPLYDIVPPSSSKSSISPKLTSEHQDPNELYRTMNGYDVININSALKSSSSKSTVPRSDLYNTMNGYNVVNINTRNNSSQQSHYSSVQEESYSQTPVSKVPVQPTPAPHLYHTVDGTSSYRVSLTAPLDQKSLNGSRSFQFPNSKTTKPTTYE